MLRDSHMISSGVSHDTRGKKSLFSPSSAEDDQMRQIEKVGNVSLSTIAHTQ